MKGKYIFIGVLAILIIIQFFRIDKTKPEYDPAKDFIFINQPEEQMANMIRGACYDCHSNDTQYPWYSNVAPVSWWIQDHIEEGREHLNFSTWADYDNKKADHKLEEAAEEVEEGEMPLKPYAWIHEPSNLSQEEREKMVAYFNDLRKQYTASDVSDTTSHETGEQEDHEH